MSTFEAAFEGSDDDDERDEDDFDHGHGADLEGGGALAGEDHAFDNPLFYFEFTPKVGDPKTPGKVRPDKEFEMKVYGRSKEMPDGVEVEFWGFEDRINRADEEPILPSSPIRVTEGDVVHVTVKPSKRQHTIHLHGIESDTHNDGVGHTSFEVTGSYTYQFRAGAPFYEQGGPPQTRGAGTYFYHCHVNTTLHVQMGMYGPLIVDPIEGPGTAFHNGPTYDVDAERLWAAGEIDPTWRELGHAAGMKGGDAGLNILRPKYFHISGEFQPMKNGKTDPNGLITSSKVATEGEVGGEPILIRWVAASYTRQEIWFEGIDSGDLEVQVIAADGRAFDNQAPNFAKPFAMTEPIEGIGGDRYDFLVFPKEKVTTVASLTTRDWIHGGVLGVARTTITGV